MADAPHYRDGRITFRHDVEVGYIHKTAKKTEKDRVIYLPDELREWVEAQIAKNGAGPIWRTPRGETLVNYLPPG